MSTTKTKRKAGDASVNPILTPIVRVMELECLAGRLRAISQLRVNPIYEALLPKLSPEEYEALKLSIKTDGQHYKIVVNENNEILDGHNRAKVCEELGIKPNFEVRTFPNKLLEKKFVIETNLKRRHLNKFQRARLLLPLLEIEKELAKQRQGERTDLARATKYFAEVTIEKTVNTRTEGEKTSKNERKTRKAKATWY